MKRLDSILLSLIILYLLWFTIAAIRATPAVLKKYRPFLKK
jgi:hypothetical protein